MDSYFSNKLALILIASLCVSETTSDKLIDTIMRALNPFRRHNTMNNQDSCFCFPKSSSGSHLPDLLKQPGHQLERLVVYLYKDPVTKEIKIYVPNIEKQQAIPDLTNEPNDLLTTASTEAFANIFDSNPWILLQDTPKDPDIQTSDNQNGNGGSGLLTDMHLEDDQQPSNVLVYNLTNEQSNPNFIDEYHTSHMPIEGSPINNEQEQSNSSDHSVQIYPVIDNQILQDIFLSNDVPITTIEEFQVVTEITPQADNHPILVGNDPESDDVLTIDVIEEIDNSWETFQLNADNTSPNIAGSNDELYVTADVHLPTLKPSPQQSHEENNQYPENNVLSELPHSQTIFTPAISKDVQDSSPSALTFDEWFKTQMKEIQNEKLVTYNSIDINLLKKRIHETLSYNGIYLSPTGILIDSNGEDLDITYLRLRPILIGDSVGYDNLMNDSSNKQFKFPKGLSYLESILITLVYPPKILGIIPLRKVFLPKEPHVRQFKASGTGDNRFKEPGMSHIHLYNNGNSQFEDGIQSSFDGESLPDEHDSSIDLSKSFKKVSNKFSPTSSQRYKKVRKPSDISESTILKKLLYKLKLQDKKVLEAANVGKIRGIDDEDLYYEESDGDISEENLVEELPGFRIIGGSAATGSGSPISIRGISV